jgi:hypothetical protein
VLHWPSSTEALTHLPSRRDGVTVPRIWVAVALSLLVHGALVLKLPQLRLAPSELPDRGDKSGALVVELAPAPMPLPEIAPALPPPLAEPPIERAPSRRAQKPVPRRVPPPAALPKAPPQIVVPPRPQAPPIASAPAEGDLSTYVEARRRARIESAPSTPAPVPRESVAEAPPAEDDNARANRIAAANLGLGRKPAFGSAPPGGGIFGIQRMTYDYAEFVFYGWNKDIRRNSAQLIEVHKGNQPDIRIAVVRRMISIIREHEQGDFIWESVRLGRNVTLSARSRDNAGLEEFMMREFFGGESKPR